MLKIIFVAHCILNTASKVVMYEEEEMEQEEELRLKFVTHAIEKGIQLVQLPCPEFTMYGAKRWGHVSNQFDNPFFRSHCRKILAPVIMEIKEYLSCPDRFKVLGIVGIDGSPSCGVNFTCSADWYGSFGNRKNLTDTLSSVKIVNKNGVFFEELTNMLLDENLSDIFPVNGLFAQNPNEIMALLDK